MLQDGLENLTILEGLPDYADVPVSITACDFENSGSHDILIGLSNQLLFLYGKVGDSYELEHVEYLEHKLLGL